jgi:antitoxin (DNA-binding transcriptional repressor) of toxin-antitoxin stability system
MTHIDLDTCDAAVKEFVLAHGIEPSGSVLEVAGRPIARLVPVVADASAEWDAAREARRRELIDREIAGALTPIEVAELSALQDAMLRYRRRVAPLPLEDARRLHAELLAKAANGQPPV